MRKIPLVIMVLGLIVAFVAIVVPILWEYYRGKKILEMRIVSAISLVERDPILEKLRIIYKNKELRNIAKINFILINTGRRPIMEGEVKQFPTIEFGNGTNIIKHRILRKDPEHLLSNILTDKNATKATIEFDLLNPTDFVEFSLYVHGRIAEPHRITARVEGIKNIRVIDKTREDPSKYRGTSQLPYSVGVTVIFCIPLLLILGKDMFQQRSVRRMVRENPRLLRDMAKRSDLLQFKWTHLSYLTERESREINALLNTQNEFMRIKSELIHLIYKKIYGVSAMTVYFYLCLVFVGSGSFYILWQLLF